MEQKNQYYVLNTVRRVHTRTQRALAPGGHRFVQRVAGNSISLSRGKFTLMNEENFNKFKDELKQKQKEGTIEVRVGSPTGPIFNFSETVEGSVSTKDKTIYPVIVEEKPIENVQVVPTKEKETVDFSKMNKSELIEYIHNLTGDPKEDLEKMLKKDLLEIVK